MQIPNVNRSIFSSSHSIMPLWPSAIAVRHNFVYSRPYSNNLFFLLTSTIQRFIHCISMAIHLYFTIPKELFSVEIIFGCRLLMWHEFQHHIFFSYLFNSSTKYAGWITFHEDINFSSESKHLIEIWADCDSIQFSRLNAFNLDFIFYSRQILRIPWFGMKKTDES